MWDPFSTSGFLLHTSWVLSCSPYFLPELWYLTCHFILQYWDFSPEKVGQAVMGGDLTSPTTYYVLANCRIGLKSNNIKTKDKQNKTNPTHNKPRWDSTQPSSVAIADTAQENFIKDCVVVGHITGSCMEWTSVFLSPCPCSTCLIVSGNGAYQLLFDSCVLPTWTIECSWKWRWHSRSCQFHFSPHPPRPEGLCACKHLPCLKSIFTTSVTLLNAKENMSPLLLSRDGNSMVK